MPATAQQKIDAVEYAVILLKKAADKQREDFNLDKNGVKLLPFLLCMANGRIHREFMIEAFNQFYAELTNLPTGVHEREVSQLVETSAELKCISFLEKDMVSVNENNLSALDLTYSNGTIDMKMAIEHSVKVLQERSENRFATYNTETLSAYSKGHSVFIAVKDLSEGNGVDLPANYVISPEYLKTQKSIYANEPELRALLQHQ